MFLIFCFSLFRYRIFLNLGLRHFQSGLGKRFTTRNNQIFFGYADRPSRASDDLMRDCVFACRLFKRFRRHRYLRSGRRGVRQCNRRIDRFTVRRSGCGISGNIVGYLQFERRGAAAVVISGIREAEVGLGSTTQVDITVKPLARGRAGTTNAYAFGSLAPATAGVGTDTDVTDAVNTIILAHFDPVAAPKARMGTVGAGGIGYRIEVIADP